MCVTVCMCVCVCVKANAHMAARVGRILRVLLTDLSRTVANASLPLSLPSLPSASRAGYKRVAWPPASEERIVREFTPQPPSQSPAPGSGGYYPQANQAAQQPSPLAAAAPAPAQVIVLAGIS